MKAHVKAYLSAAGYTVGDYIPCEMCGMREATDIHHIERRGMGGRKDADNPSNLMALCRQCHMEYGDKKQHKARLQAIHDIVMETW